MQSKLNRHGETVKCEPSQQKNQLIKTDPQTTQRLKLGEKNFKTAVINAPKNLQENVNIMGKERGIFRR